MDGQIPAGGPLPGDDGPIGPGPLGPSPLGPVPSVPVPSVPVRSIQASFRGTTSTWTGTLSGW
jgi:hypothetical protein